MTNVSILVVGPGCNPLMKPGLIWQLHNTSEGTGETRYSDSVISKNMVEEHVGGDVLCQLLGILELICNKLVTSRVGQQIALCTVPFILAWLPFAADITDILRKQTVVSRNTGKTQVQSRSSRFPIEASASLHDPVQQP